MREGLELRLKRQKHQYFWRGKEGEVYLPCFLAHNNCKGSLFYFIYISFNLGSIKAIFNSGVTLSL